MPNLVAVEADHSFCMHEVRSVLNIVMQHHYTVKFVISKQDLLVMNFKFAISLLQLKSLSLSG
jgi:hypothetical protein